MTVLFPKPWPLSRRPWRDRTYDDAKHFEAASRLFGIAHPIGRNWMARSGQLLVIPKTEAEVITIAAAAARHGGGR